MSHQNISSPDMWAPSMPNSDLWTIVAQFNPPPDLPLTIPMQRPSTDAAQLISPHHNPLSPRRVVALRKSPLGRYLPLTASSSGAGTAGSAATLESQEPLSQSATSQHKPASSPAALGLGHPSTSKRRCSPLESDSAAPASRESPPKRARLNSSTIKPRTERFPARSLQAIAEHPVPIARNQQQQEEPTPRPVPGAHKRSYTKAASGSMTSLTHHTGTRVTPTTSTTSTPASPTFIPNSPCCASTSRKHSSGGTAMALAPRHSSAGAPQAGPTQVQSPRVLLPTTLAGSPNFQSLDGTVLAITQALSEERREGEGEGEGGEEETGFEGELDCSFYGEEDGFMKFRVHTHLRIRFAARRLKMLF